MSISEEYNYIFNNSCNRNQVAQMSQQGERVGWNAIPTLPLVFNRNVGERLPETTQITISYTFNLSNEDVLQAAKLLHQSGVTTWGGVNLDVLFGSK